MIVRRVVRVGAWMLLFAALGAAAAAWFTPVPHLDAADAARVARGALAAAGVDAELSGAPTQAEHRTRDGDEVSVWVVAAEVDVEGRSEVIELRVQRSAGRVVYLDDRVGPDDARRLLDDDQFAALGGYRDDSVSDDWVLRNGAAGVSGVLVAVTSYVLATRSALTWRDR